MLGFGFSLFQKPFLPGLLKKYVYSDHLIAMTLGESGIHESMIKQCMHITKSSKNNYLFLLGCLEHYEDIDINHLFPVTL